jgi:peptidoglycan/LPS O-acetylase OafA/YrhL
LKRWQSLNRVPIRQFYRFRFARIGPPLFLLLVALSCLHLAGIQGFVINPARATLSQALTAALTFRVNVLQARVGELPACWNVLWTLSIEEVFYIAFPLVCRLLGSERQVVFVLLCLIVAGPFARVLGPHKTDPQDQTYLCCMDGIAFGCLAAIFVWRVRLKPLALRCLLGTGLAAIILIDVFRTQTVQLGLVSTGLYVTVLEIGVSLIVIALWSGAVPTSFGWKPHLLTFFGRNSYEIYLTHSFVVVALTRLYRWQIPGREMVLPWYFAILALSGGVGYMLARLYSIPLNDLLRQHRK